MLAHFSFKGLSYYVYLNIEVEAFLLNGQHGLIVTWCNKLSFSSSYTERLRSIMRLATSVCPEGLIAHTYALLKFICMLKTTFVTVA